MPHPTATTDDGTDVVADAADVNDAVSNGDDEGDGTDKATNVLADVTDAARNGNDEDDGVRMLADVAETRFGDFVAIFTIISVIRMQKLKNTHLTKVDNYSNCFSRNSREIIC